MLTQGSPSHALWDEMAYRNHEIIIWEKKSKKTNNKHNIIEIYKEIIIIVPDINIFCSRRNTQNLIKEN